MGPYLAIVVFLVIVPFTLGLLYSYAPTLIAILFIALIPATLVILKLCLDERRKTIDLWKTRLDTQISQSGDVDLSVVVPAYNEQYRLPKMLDETLSFLEARRDDVTKLPFNIYRHKKFTYEIIVVDDGSSDKTSDCALQYTYKYGSDKVRLLKLKANKGKGGAVREGVLASRGDYILFADADGASKFCDVEKLEEHMYKHRADRLLIAIGSRAHMEQEAVATRSLFRTILMKGFHWLVWICFVRTVRDTQCGFKMFNREAATVLFSSYHNESWAFDVELLFLAEQIKCAIGEIAINWTEIEGSKIVPVFSWIRMGYDVVCLALLYSLGIYRVPKVALMANK